MKPVQDSGDPLHQRDLEDPDDQRDAVDQGWVDDLGVLEGLADLVSPLQSHLVVCQQNTMYSEEKLG